MQLTIVEISLSRGITFSEAVRVDGGGVEIAVVVARTGGSPVYVDEPPVAATQPFVEGDIVAWVVGDLWYTVRSFLWTSSADGSTRVVPLQCGRIVA